MDPEVDGPDSFDLTGFRDSLPTTSGPTVSTTRLEAGEPEEGIVQQPVVKESNFLILINSNMRPKDNAESAAMTDALASVMQQMLDNPQPMIRMIEGDYEANVRDIKSNYSIELGPEGRVGFDRLSNRREGKTRGGGGRIHSHALMEITHTARVNLNLAYIRQHVPAALRQHGFNVRSIYLNVKGFGSKQNIIQYIGKDSALGRLVTAQSPG